MGRSTPPTTAALGVEARPAVLGAAAQVEFHAGLAETVTGETIAISPSTLAYSLREPFGVVGVIIPWNAPLAMFYAKVSAALAAGNTVVVKPPERASVSILAAAKYLAEVGIPPGVVNVVCGEGRRRRRGPGRPPRGRPRSASPGRRRPDVGSRSVRSAT